ncbi:hypothetical protein [Desulfotomaculum copahuensis]|nr:hypothetical protein [Desulfotomaculum copahuensis]
MDKNKFSQSGLTLVEIVIAAMLLAVVVTVLSAVVVQQAKLKQRMSEENFARQLLEQELKEYSVRVSRDDTAVHNDPPGQFDGKVFEINPVISTEKSFPVTLPNGDTITYSLYRVTVTVSWGAPAGSVTATTLVSNELNQAASGD